MLKFTDISEERTASIFRVNSTPRPTYCLRLAGSLLGLLLYHEDGFPLTSANFYRITRHHIPEDGTLRIHMITVDDLVSDYFMNESISMSVSKTRSFVCLRLISRN
jgi:hypothetical protein